MPLLLTEIAFPKPIGMKRFRGRKLMLVARSANAELKIDVYRCFKAFSKIEKVAAKPTDECAPNVVVIRTRTLITRYAL